MDIHVINDSKKLVLAALQKKRGKVTINNLQCIALFEKYAEVDDNVTSELMATRDLGEDAVKFPRLHLFATEQDFLRYVSTTPSDRTRLVVVDDLNKEKSFESAVKVAVRETSGNKMLNVKFQKTKSALMQHKTLFTFQEDRLCKMSEATTSEKRRLFQFSATKVDPELSSQCTHIIRERTFMAMMALLAQKCATSEEYLCPTTGRFDMDIHVIN
eukprot:scpid91263/ scgid3271/ 